METPERGGRAAAMRSFTYRKRAEHKSMTIWLVGVLDGPARQRRHAPGLRLSLVRARARARALVALRPGLRSPPVETRVHAATRLGIERLSEPDDCPAGGGADLDLINELLKEAGGRCASIRRPHPSLGASGEVDDENDEQNDHENADKP